MTPEGKDTVSEMIDQNASYLHLHSPRRNYYCGITARLTSCRWRLAPPARRACRGRTSGRVHRSVTALPAVNDRAVSRRDGDGTIHLYVRRVGLCGRAPTAAHSEADSRAFPLERLQTCQVVKVSACPMYLSRSLCAYL